MPSSEGRVAQLGRGAAALASRLPGVATPASLRVEVTLPDHLPPAVVGGFEQEARELLVGLLDDLSVERTLQLSVHTRRTPDVEISIDRRPVAHLALSNDLVGDPPALVTQALSAVTARLPVVAGVGPCSRSSAGYVCSVGRRVPTDLPDSSLEVGRAEHAIGDRDVEEIVVEAPLAIVRNARAADLDAVPNLRRREYRKRGMRYPNVRLVIQEDRPGLVRLRLNDVRLPGRRFDHDAGWGAVVRYLSEEITRRRHWYVREQHVARMLDEDLSLFFPDLVAVIRERFSPSEISACLRELVRSGWRVRNLSRILWTLLEQGGSPAGPDILRLDETPLLPDFPDRVAAERDPVLMAIRVRKLSVEERWRLGTYASPTGAARLPAELEELLTVIDRSTRLAKAEWSAVRAVAARPSVNMIVTRTVEALAPVRDALQCLAMPPLVVSSHELPPDADLGALMTLV